MTPQPQSIHKRRSHCRKVAFTTPGIQAQRPHTDTPAALAYTPLPLYNIQVDCMFPRCSGNLTPDASPDVLLGVKQNT